MDQPKAFVFDAYGTLFDVRSVLARCEEVFPGHGGEVTTLVAHQTTRIHLAALADGPVRRFLAGDSGWARL